MTQRHRPWSENSACILLFVGSPVTFFGLYLVVSGLTNIGHVISGLILIAIGVVLMLTGFAVYRM